MAKLDVFHAPNGRLRVQREDDRCWLDAKPVWAAPRSRPGRYLALLDSKNEEIALLEYPERELSVPSWQAVQDELWKRDLTAEVTLIREAKQEFNATYWTVETNRGTREFVAQSLSENAVWISDTHLLLVDVEGNRFEIANTEALDARSRALLFGIV